MKKLLLLTISAILLILCTTSCAEITTQKATLPDASEATSAHIEPETEHIFKKSNFKTDKNGFLTYSDKLVYSLKGIDVSSYSGDIDWKKVAESGFDFAMIRLGGRGYGESGALYTDEKAFLNIDGAKKNGIKVGGYFFSQATTEEEAFGEAEYALEIVGDEKLDLPIAYDFEHIEDDEARTDSVKNKDIRKFSKAFSKVITQKGYESMIYGEDEDFYDIYNESVAPKWIAEYDNTPEINESVKIWQYSKDAEIDGISGSVNLNIMFKERQ